MVHFKPLKMNVQITNLRKKINSEFQAHLLTDFYWVYTLIIFLDFFNCHRQSSMQQTFTISTANFQHVCKDSLLFYMKVTQLII